MATGNNNEVTGWVGWIYFAGFMMIMLGIFQSIAGLTALLNDKFYVATTSHLVAFDVTTWGWIQLLLGIIVISAGMSLFSGRMWARVVGVLLASTNLVTQFAFVNAYPVWSIIMMTVDVMIIYALTVHGGEARIDE
jgi:hypothetical protein